MNIEDLPEPIKTWAKVNRDESELDHIDDIFHAFLWNKTKESLEFWRDVYDSKSLEYLKKEYPHLPWIDKNNCSVVLENDHEKRHWISLDVKGSYDAYKHLLKNSESVRVYISDGVYDGWDFKDKNNSDDPSYSLSEYDPSYKPKTSNSIITTGAEDSVWVVRDQSDWHNPDYSATGFKGDTFTYLPSIKTHEITETEKFEWIESKPSPSTLEYMRDVEKARQILSESLLIFVHVFIINIV